MCSHEKWKPGTPDLTEGERGLGEKPVRRTMLAITKASIVRRTGFVRFALRPINRFIFVLVEILSGEPIILAGDATDAPSPRSERDPLGDRWSEHADGAARSSGGRGIRGKIRTTTERAWFFAEGEKSEGGVSERVSLAGRKRACFPPCSPSADLFFLPPPSPCLRSAAKTCIKNPFPVDRGHS